MPIRLDWEGKPTHVERLSLPFQTVETINESRATRERDTGALFEGPASERAGRNLLVWGDNKLVMSSLLKEYAGQIKLIYIDPPFDTGADFSHRVRVGDESVQKLPSILEEHAYRDTWGRGRSSYLSMMLERVTLIRDLLSDDGSFYLHCAPNVSHHLKLLCDEVLGAEAFKTEIVWKRSSAHSDSGQGRRQYGAIHDVILFYALGDRWTWTTQYTEYDEAYLGAKYRNVDAASGRRYRLDNLTGPGGEAKGNPRYEVMGVTRHWRYSENRMSELIAEGRIVQTKPGGVPQYKRYLDEMPGVPVQDVWTDIDPVNSQGSTEWGTTPRSRSR